MLNFTKDDIKFLEENVSESYNIINAVNVRDALVIFSNWIATSDKCWDDTGDNYSDFGRNAQKVYDNILENN